MGKEINPINSHATRKRHKFDKAFKLNAVALLKAGQKPATWLALELGIRHNLLYKWAETLAKHDGDVNTAFNGPGHNKLGKQHDPILAENKWLKRGWAGRKAAGGLKNGHQTGDGFMNGDCGKLLLGKAMLGLALLGTVAAWAQSPELAPAAPAASAAKPKYQNMDWMYADDNRPQPQAVAGGLFEPMDWSVLDVNVPVRLEAVNAAALQRIVTAPWSPDFPKCLAATFIDSPGQTRPFMLHANGRLGGGLSLINLNGALRSGISSPRGRAPGIFYLFVHNFLPIQDFGEWQAGAMTNPLPASLIVLVESAVRVPGAKTCRIGGARCRIYKGTLALSWAQPGLSLKQVYDPVTLKPVDTSKPDDLKPHEAPAQSGRLNVVFEDPCWGTRDGFIEAYANRSRVFERLHRWMN